MKNISIPNTDLTLSAIGLGTVNAGIAWDHADAYRIFDSFLGAGGSLIDTAHVYSDWIPGETARAERVVGEWIKSRGGKHDDFVLMTKGGHPRNDTMDVSRMSRDDMEGDLDSSLLQLGVDCVDIYFYHRDDQNQTVDELIEVMESFRRAGKIRYYACSNWTTARMQAADQYCRAHGYRGFVANQDLYNMGVAHMLPYPDPTMVVCDGEMLEYHKLQRLFPQAPEKRLGRRGGKLLQHPGKPGNRQGAERAVCPPRPHHHPGAPGLLPGAGCAHAAPGQRQQPRPAHRAGEGAANRILPRRLRFSPGVIRRIETKNYHFF